MNGKFAGRRPWGRELLEGRTMTYRKPALSHGGRSAWCRYTASMSSRGHRETASAPYSEITPEIARDRWRCRFKVSA